MNEKTTLEDILAFKKELRDSYDNKTDHNILPKVKSFLLDHPDPRNAGVDTLFLKYITKKASHAMHESRKDNETLSREVVAIAAAYCEEAIRRLDEREYVKEGMAISEEDRKKMIGHLHAHAADFLENQSDKTTDAVKRKRLLRAAFKKLNTAISIATELNEERYVPSLYLARATVEGRLADIIEGAKKLSWVEKEAKDRRKGAEGKQNDQPNMAAQIYKYSADRQTAFAELFPDKKQEFLETAYQDLENAARLSTEAKFAAFRFEEKSRIAKQLAEIAEPKFIWVLNGIMDAREAIKLIEDSEKISAAYFSLAQQQLKIAGNCPFTQDVLQQAYLDLEYAEKFAQNKAEVYAAKADIAQKLFEMTNGQTKLDWLIKEVNDWDLAASNRKCQVEKASDYFAIAAAWNQAAKMKTPEMIEFAENAIFARKMGMDLIEKDDPRRWVIECRKNDVQSSRLHDETGELKYAREAVEYSKMTLQYYAEHPYEDPNRRITRLAQDRINWYRRFTQRKSGTSTNYVFAQKPQMAAEEHIAEGIEEMNLNACKKDAMAEEK